MKVKTIGDATLYLGDCLDHLQKIPDQSVDMILCDLPYGITENAWDCVIPLDQLWANYWRVCKPSAPIVLTACQPFTSLLVMSQKQNFKYQWIWEKGNATGFLNAKKQPLRAHEDILVFYKQQPNYFPQMHMREPYFRKERATNSENYGISGISKEINSNGARFPRSVVQFNSVNYGDHPTQKPIALMEYLILTYTKIGDVVLDNCFGSGTTGVAAIQQGRRFIGMELEKKYFEIGSTRIEQAAKQSQLFGVSGSGMDSHQEQTQ